MINCEHTIAQRVASPMGIPKIVETAYAIYQDLSKTIVQGICRNKSQRRFRA